MKKLILFYALSAALSGTVYAAADSNRFPKYGQYNLDAEPASIPVKRGYLTLGSNSAEFQREKKDVVDYIKAKQNEGAICSKEMTALLYQVRKSKTIGDLFLVRDKVFRLWEIHDDDDYAGLPDVRWKTINAKTRPLLQKIVRTMVLGEEAYGDFPPPPETITFIKF